MIRILVADDENTIRQGIITILKRALDKDITYLEAEDGNEALKLCNEKSPQIVITDIRMPSCNGLEFIKKVKETEKSPIVIILTGYADFEYAKSAITMGVNEYVLKPIKKPEFIAMVDGYIKKLTDQNQQIKIQCASESANKKATETLKTKLLINLLNCSEISSAKEYVKGLTDLGVNLQQKLLLVAIVQYRIDEQNKDYIDFAVKNIAYEVIGQETQLDSIINVSYDYGRIVSVFGGLEHKSVLDLARHMLGKLATFFHNSLTIEVFVGIGDVIYGSEFLRQSFQNACKALDFKLYSTGLNVKLYSEMELRTEYKPVKFDDLAQPLENINSAEIISRLESLMHIPPSISAISVIKQSYELLIEEINNQLKKYNGIKKPEIQSPPCFSELWSFSQLKHEVIRYVNQVREFASAKGNDVPKKKLAVDILKYVKDNYANDINLNIVADHFSRTPEYISALFKKDLGIGFNEYLTDYRMEMAKDMIENTGIPISEVSKFCGYSNSKYFSVIFKKTFGKSPSDYRQDNI